MKKRAAAGDALQASQRLIDCLRRSPQAFPHPVDGEVACIETHISWVLLAGDYAYKLKKPLRLDFLDYSTLALRRAACEEELRINRRAAPGLYLGVVPVTGTAAAPRLGGEGPVLDWAVQMRRFDQAALLSRLIEQGRLLPEQVDRLARQLARFHAAAAVAPADGAFGTPGTVCSLVQQVVDPLRESVARLADPALAAGLAAVARWTEAQGQGLGPLFAQRLAQGHVRECHGDLHLGNLVLLDGEPQLFDAIEFNPRFRWIDCMADLAFVLMDLQARGRADLAWRLLNAWLEQTGDYAGLRLLPYYLVYRALVRARVAGLRRAQLTGEARQAAVQELGHYLDLAARFTRERERRLWLTCGVSGSGKSSQSQALVEARGLVRLRADVERKRLFGLSPEASSAGVVGGGIYTAEASRRTYARLAQLARELLAAGLPVLVDATFLHRAQRAAFRALARELGVPCLILAFEAPEAVLRERVRQRALAGGDASEADEAVLQSQLAHREPLDEEELAEAVVVDTREAVDWAALLPPEKTA